MLCGYYICNIDLYTHVLYSIYIHARTIHICIYARHTHTHRHIYTHIIIYISTYTYEIISIYIDLDNKHRDSLRYVTYMYVVPVFVIQIYVICEHVIIYIYIHGLRMLDIICMYIYIYVDMLYTTHTHIHIYIRLHMLELWQNTHLQTGTAPPSRATEVRRKVYSPGLLL